MDFQHWLEQEAPKDAGLERLVTAARPGVSASLRSGRVTTATAAFLAHLQLYLIFFLRVAVRPGSTPTPPATNQDDPAHLKRVLDDSFSDSDLRDLCFELRVDYDSLPGSAKSDKTRELVLYLQRRGRIAELGEALHRLRPNLIARENTN